jgi:hypothetical protein
VILLAKKGKENGGFFWSRTYILIPAKSWKEDKTSEMMAQGTVLLSSGVYNQVQFPRFCSR